MSNMTLFARALRTLSFTLIRIFYPRIEVKGREHLPTNRPIVFVLNHPNGLMDSLVLTEALKRPLAFLGKSTLFGNPLGKAVMEAFGSLPVYRRRDDGLPGGPKGDANERNEVTFARCRAILAEGGGIALCPEGTTHSNPQLLPMRTGAARIVLGAEEAMKWGGEVQVVPVGLWFQSKVQFRSSVLIVIGEPFGLAGYKESYLADKEETVDQVTDKISDCLDKVVLQAENTELLAAAPIIASWIAPEGEALTLDQQHEWVSKLLPLYEKIRKEDPERLEAFSEQARHYANTLHMLGIEDPWTLEEPITHLDKLGKLLVKLLIGFPFALGGFILSYIPYRLVGPIATRLAPDDTQTSSFKLIGGSIFVFLSWILEAIAVGYRYGALKGVLLLAINPPLAYIALHWGEGWHKVRDITSCKWLRWQRGKFVQSLVTQRQLLAKQVMDAMQAE